MSPVSISFRSANIPKTAAPVTKDIEKETLVVISPLHSSPIDVLRDVRDYERQRQRTKKNVALAKMKERKERGALWAQWGDNPKSPAVHSARASWFGGKDNRNIWDDDNEIEEKDHLEVEHSPRVAFRTHDVRREVKLTDLVTSRKSRKIVGTSSSACHPLAGAYLSPCFAEEDFEVIPAPRTVIVMDDFVAHDMDVDESWEYVYGENEKARGPSYAQIVSTGK